MNPLKSESAVRDYLPRIISMDSKENQLIRDIMDKTFLDDKRIST